MTSSFLNGGTTYPGGKGGCYQHIINLMPPHSRYIETHLGAGAVMRRKRPAQSNIGIEADPRVVARWRAFAMPGLSVLQGDALTVLPSLDVTEDDLVYCDPPYVPATRRRPRVYCHDYDVSDHERLLAMLGALPCRVLLSGYDNPLYGRLLVGWHRLDFASRTRGGPSIESVWTNFKPGDVLHDYSYVGDDFRERERLRRRINALCMRLARAEPIERNAALAALCDIKPDAVVAAARRLI